MLETTGGFVMEPKTTLIYICIFVAGIAVTLLYNWLVTQGSIIAWAVAVDGTVKPHACYETQEKAQNAAENFVKGNTSVVQIQITSLNIPDQPLDPMDC